MSERACCFFSVIGAPDHVLDVFPGHVLAVDLAQSRGIGPFKPASREVGEGDEPLCDRLLIELEDPSWRAFGVCDGLESQRALALGLAVPKVDQGIREDAIVQRGLRAAAEGVLPLMDFLQQAQLAKQRLCEVLGRATGRARGVAAQARLQVARDRRGGEAMLRVELAGVARQGLFELLASESGRSHMVEQPMPCGGAKASARELPMGEPRGRGTLRVGVEAAILQDLGGEAADSEAIGSLAHDAACHGPMPNRCHHVLAYAEGSDCALVSEGSLGDHAATDGLVEGLFEPHLTQGKRLVPGKVGRRASAALWDCLHGTYFSAPGIDW